MDQGSHVFAGDDSDGVGLDFGAPDSDPRLRLSDLGKLLRRTQRGIGRCALSVSADQLEAALDELLDTRNAMTRALLGGTRPGNERLPR